MAPAEERQQMMLAQTVEVDVAHDHHLAIIDGEQRAVQHLIDVGLVAAREKLQRLFHPLRRPDQPFARRILAELDQQARDQILHLGIVYRGFCASVTLAGTRSAGRSRRALSRSRHAGERARGRRASGRARLAARSEGLRVGVEAGARAVLAGHQRPAAERERKAALEAGIDAGRKAVALAAAASRGAFLDRRQHGRARRIVRPAARHQVSRADSRRARDGAEDRSRLSAGLRRSRARPLVLQSARAVRRRQEEVGSSTCARRWPTTRRA